MTDATHNGRAVVLMGVSGAGKSTVAAALAARLHVRYFEGDDLHSPENRKKMSEGHPLNDEDRRPWLRAIGQLLEREVTQLPFVIVTCSALKRNYRDVLRSFVATTDFIELTASLEVLEARVSARHTGFMPASLLGSQLATLEPLASDERGLVVNVENTTEEVVDQILTFLQVTDAPESSS